ncbi:hypothetical protein ABW21_db0203905 [Orbilia brochopaga]|nr:hypothetical protein ABW21_db0203905 [Drechslerella brochopaga]
MDLDPTSPLVPYRDELFAGLEQEALDPVVFDGIDPKLAREIRGLLKDPEFDKRTRVQIRLPSYVNCYLFDIMWKALERWSLPDDFENFFRIIGSPGYTQYRFEGDFAGSIKEPSYSIIRKGAAFPSFVVETGFKESYSELRRDVDMWLQGSGGAVKAVLLIKAEAQVGDEVTGFLELWRAGSPTAKRIDLQLENDDKIEEENPFITLGDLCGDRKAPKGWKKSKDQELPFPLESIRTSLQWGLDVDRKHGVAAPLVTVPFLV